MNALIDNFFNLGIYAQVLPYLLTGLWTTVWLSALIIPAGLAAGLLVALGMTETKSRLIRWPLALYVDFLRSFPPLVLLIFIFFGTPFVGIELNNIFAVVLSFGLSSSSYYAEIFRAGIESIPPGQTEAARSTGLSKFQNLRLVVIPQAVRNVMADLIGNSIEVVKMTSLASVVAITELLRSARDTQSVLYNPSPIVLAAVLYLILLLPFVRLLSVLEERRMAASGHD